MFSRRFAFGVPRPIVCLETIERRILFAAYGPDPSFGSGGHAPAASQIQIVPLDNGQVYTVGYYATNGGGFDEQDVVHYTGSVVNDDGTLDPAFDGDGTAEYADSLRSVKFINGRLMSVAPQADVPWRIVAFTLEGPVDTSYSGDGLVDIPYVKRFTGGVSSVNAYIAQGTSDGGMLLVVTVQRNSPYAQNQEIVKLKPDGTVDTSFADDGFLVLASDQVDITATLSNKSLLVTQGTYNARKLVRYSPDGKTIDTSFGVNGALDLGTDLTYKELPDGKILWLKTVNESSVDLVRLTTTGAVDATFGNNGKVTLTADEGTLYAPDGIEIDPSGRIWVFAKSSLFRLGASGTPDGDPFDGGTKFGAGVRAFDHAGKLLAGSTTLTRYDILDPISVGNDHKLYVEGTDANDAVTIAAGAAGKWNVTLNGSTTAVSSAGLIGVEIHLQDGDNSAVVSLDVPATVTSGKGSDTITTADGDDSILCGTGNDTVSMGDGNDLVHAEYGNSNSRTEHHQITGGNGNKDIQMDGGFSDITLGVGDSKIYCSGSSGNDTVNVAGGKNDVTCYGGSDTITIGGSGNNHVLVGIGDFALINTGSGDDEIHGMEPMTVHSNEGNDTIILQSMKEDGDNLIFAGAGNDTIKPYDIPLYRPAATIYGEDGNDKIYGGSDAQAMYGGAGKDTIYGGTGGDLISGGGGNDRLFGEGGKDRIYGGVGRDIIMGGANDDRLLGGASGDWIYTNGGNDQVSGEGGDDRIFADYAGAAIIHGGAGNDSIVSTNGRIDQLFGDGGRDSATADATDVLTSIEQNG